MSSRRWVWQMWAICAALAASGVSRAQAQSQAEYRARIQALVPMWKAEGMGKRRQDSIRVHALPTDTVRAEGLLIVTDPKFEELARHAAGPAVAMLHRQFGNAGDSTRTKVLILTTTKSSSRDTPMVETAEIDSLGRVADRIELPATAEMLAENWAQRISTFLTNRLDPNFRRWLNGAIPIDSATRATWAAVRIGLVTSSNRVARDCYAGDIRACEFALGIAGENDPATHWFNAAEREGIVWDLRSRLRQGQVQRYDRCVSHGEDSVCTALLEQLGAGMFAPPLPPDARQGLTQLAMSIGGPEAYSRMAAVTGSYPDLLPAAAGISIDSLARAWRSEVMATKAEQTTMTPALALMSLFWATTCGVLALGSSRWR